MRRDIFIEHDYSTEFDLSDATIVIPDRKFMEMRLPKLSENSSISDDDKRAIMADALRQSTYCPTEKKNPFGDSGRYIYVVGEDAETRNGVAASIINYLSDSIDYRNSVAEGIPLELNVLHIDAKQTLAEEIPTDLVDGDGLVKKLVPLEFPEAQRNNYRNKVGAAERIMADRGKAYALLLPDLDDIVSLGANKGWTPAGRMVLCSLERINKGNCFTVGTLKPDSQILYGNNRQAGLNKTYNTLVNTIK